MHSANIVFIQENTTKPSTSLYSVLELLMRIELTTSSLPRKCSTPELQRLLASATSGIKPKGSDSISSSDSWSGRPGSNRPPEAWKATALPNELLPLLMQI